MEMIFVLAVNFSFLLQLAASRSAHGQRALDMTLHTLSMMAHGGMHDHIGQVRVDCFIASCTVRIYWIMVYIQTVMTIQLSYAVMFSYNEI